LIIPAAGLGSRLRSSVPKPLVLVNGRPMLESLLRLYRALVDRIVLVVHPAFEQQMRSYGASTGAPLEYEVQAGPTGMLDAILLGRQHVVDASEIWITWCDQIAIRPTTIDRLIALRRTHPDAHLIMPTASRQNPYIHLGRGPNGRIVRVLHRREGDSLPAVGESDIGLFSLSRSAYLEDLTEFAASSATGASTGERNFLPFIAWLAPRGEVITFPCTDDIEAVGINTPEELQIIERYLAERNGGAF
jgi:bifunctional UDP-N-acetylglucosamine pyrophosphorylase/glucosamine-1-phosphate N-acetyltransferase